MARSSQRYPYRCVTYARIVLGEVAREAGEEVRISNGYSDQNTIAWTRNGSGFSSEPNTCEPIVCIAAARPSALNTALVEIL
jgi:hypothetical protein